MSDEPEPETVSKGWRRAYLAVSLCFVVQVALFYAFTRYYS